MAEYVLLKEKNFNKLKDFVKKNSDKKIVFTSEDDELNRKVLEKLKIDVLLVPLENRKDFQKQRNSGFNQVLAKIARKNKISIGIDLDEIIDSEEKQKAEILGRLVQNIKLCNKNKIQMHFLVKKHLRNIYDLRSLGLVLGMLTWMTKKLEVIKYD